MKPVTMMIDDVKYVREDSISKPQELSGDSVVVRATAGVFFGKLIKKDGPMVQLGDARQVWSWDSKGLSEPVNTVGDIALRGVGSGSKVSSPTPSVILDGVSATYYATTQAVAVFGAQKWGVK
jgi:hypothetical protein